MPRRPKSLEPSLMGMARIRGGTGNETRRHDSADVAVGQGERRAVRAHIRASVARLEQRVSWSAYNSTVPSLIVMNISEYLMESLMCLVYSRRTKSNSSRRTVGRA